MNNKQSPEQLWHTLQQAGVVSGEMPALADIDVSPWYVRVFQGLTGQFAALFLLMFFFTIFKDLVKEQTVAFVLGGMLIGAAYAVFNVRSTAFTGQFGLTLSLTGQALWFFALSDWLNDPMAWMIIAIVEGALAWMMPHFLHRFLSSYAAAMALIFACYQLPFLWLMPSLMMFVVAILWLHEPQWLAQSERFRPLAYAFTFAALQMHSLVTMAIGDISHSFRGQALSTQTWLIPVNEMLLGGILVFTIIKLLMRYQVALTSKHGLAAMLAGCLLALLSLQATGLAVAWVVILLGFSSGNRLLLGIGFFAFWSFLGRYYYFLNISLLDKSYVLIGTGILMLLMRQVLKYGLSEESHHA